MGLGSEQISERLLEFAENPLHAPAEADCELSVGERRRRSKTENVTPKAQCGCEVGVSKETREPRPGAAIVRCEGAAGILPVMAECSRRSDEQIRRNGQRRLKPRA